MVIGLKGTMLYCKKSAALLIAVLLVAQMCDLGFAAVTSEQVGQEMNQTGPATTPKALQDKGTRAQSQIDLNNASEEKSAQVNVKAANVIMPRTTIRLPDGRTLIVESSGKWKLQDAAGNYWTIDFSGNGSMQYKSGGKTYTFDSLGTYLYQNYGKTEEFRLDAFNKYTGEITKIVNFIAAMIVGSTGDAREQLKNALGDFLTRMPRTQQAAYYYDSTGRFIARLTKDGYVQYLGASYAGILGTPAPNSFKADTTSVYLFLCRVENGVTRTASYSYNTQNGLNGILRPANDSEAMTLLNNLRAMYLAIQDLKVAAASNAALLDTVNGYSDNMKSALGNGNIQMVSETNYWIMRSNFSKEKYTYYTANMGAHKYMISERIEANGRRTVFYNQTRSFNSLPSQIAYTIYETNGSVKEYFNSGVGTPWNFIAGNQMRKYYIEGSYAYLVVRENGIERLYRQDVNNLTSPMVLISIKKA